ncbi:MAG: hypothetical protein ACP5I8_16600 [Phycisphaerae bacterium]
MEPSAGKIKPKFTIRPNASANWNNPATKTVPAPPLITPLHATRRGRAAILRIDP